jgi:hypothetical protein
MRATTWSGGLLLALALAGCSGPNSFFAEKKTLGKESDVILTDAGARGMTATNIPPSDAVGHFAPRQINCAEPSPDVAKAIDTAFSAGISVSVTAEGAQLPADAQAKIAGAVARARSEALAQMTERLPTIQLLRDGLFRACEAYANGALSPTSYALMLSRYGDTMVTMLSSDLIAGDFGRQLAAISGSASSASSSSLDDEGQSAQMSQRNLQEAAGDLANKAEDANKALAEVQKEKAAGLTSPTAPTDETQPTVNTVTETVTPTAPTAPANPAEAAAAAAATTTTTTTTPVPTPAPEGTDGGTTKETPAEANLTQKLDELEKASRSFKDKLAAAAQASSAAQATAASGFAAQDIANERAGMIADMQRLYLQHPSPGALLVACITALDRMPGTRSPFSTLCDSLLPQTTNIIGAQVGAQLEAYKGDSALDIMKQDVSRTLKTRDTIKALETAKPVPTAGKSVSDTVTQVQTVLQQLGLYKGKIDGLAGRGTTTAIRKIQQLNGLPITGLLDDVTQEKILAAKKA